MDAFGVDFSDAHGLWTLLNTVQQLQEGISDTEMTAGSEAYQAALVFYHSVKMAAAQDIPGAKAVYEELKTRFPAISARAVSLSRKMRRIFTEYPSGFKTPKPEFGASQSEFGASKLGFRAR